LIQIAGGGLTGLSCALELINNGHEIEIFEARQEIGNPIRSPGWVTIDMGEKINKASSATLTEHGWALRREWLEKALAIEVVDKGGIIHLKHRLSHQINAIDCLGNKTETPGWPGKADILQKKEKLTPWVGGIVIEEDLPDSYSVNTIEENKLCLQRGDGLIECWERSSFSINPEKGWLELMNGDHPHDVMGLCGDHAINLGKKLALEVKV
jgi:hypothetical protein